MTSAHQQPLTSNALPSYHDVTLSHSACSSEGEDVLLTIQSSLDLHSCSTHKFFQELPSDFKHYKDIVQLIAKYYTPQQESIQPIKHSLQSSLHPLKVRCNSVPIPSWTVPSSDERSIKRFPSKCPYLTQHLTLEFLFWLLVLLFFRTGGPTIGSMAVLFVFYLLIQSMIWSMGCLYGDGFYRYQHVTAAPLFSRQGRIEWFNRTFDWTPQVTMSMDLHQSDSMADMGWDTIDYAVHVNECSTFIEPNVGKAVGADEDDIDKDGQYPGWLYCIEYETDVDFVDTESRNRFEKLCVGFIRHHIREHMVYHLFDVNVSHDVVSGYNSKYWSGYMIVLNTRCQGSQKVLQWMIKLFNILCLSIVYKIPLLWMTKKRVKVAKYLGFRK